MNELNFTSENQKLKVVIPNIVLDEIHILCTSSYPNETGGILVGFYNEQYNSAIISKLIPPPSDSKSGPTWFIRGINGVKKKLDQLWYNEKEYYIGEWHYHPGSSSNLSNQDIKQMSEISNNDNYKCPEPILLIVGGEYKNWEYSTYVFPKNNKLIHLDVLNELC
ncbi:Mov34/MPN/PAD-1 family protein [Exiguobacterium sp. KJ 601]|uniref:Mov34/MPN/PAD-1 family protein n=1 Tax=Exiguobacterium sp. KJ 601 TaxID=2782569 RepID=UPI0022B00B89|nr:Mov34/MPN/PAD-1 family protein [Exiguobacterium sp. KJ 601]